MTTKNTAKKAENQTVKAENNDIITQTENIVLSLAKAGLFHLIDETIRSAKCDAESLLAQEYKQEKEAKLSEIDNLIAQTALPEVKALLQAEKEKIENEGNVPSLMSTSNFQAAIDDFFLTGLNGAKKKSMLAKTEAEASISGTNCINYLMRNALLNKAQNVSVNELLEKTTYITGKYYRSVGHVRQIIENLNKAGLCKASSKNKTINIQY